MTYSFSEMPIQKVPAVQDTGRLRPYLSVVVTARNDNHGGDMLYRMHHFLAGLLEQCDRYRLSAELIIVEWNPPEGREPLAKVLTIPKNNRFCKVRIIQVPKELHLTLQHSDKLPLFQMIGKNVGIRRALGKFILATNIDILLTDSLIRFIKKKLKPGYSYRVDRMDVPNQLPNTDSFAKIRRFCRSNVIRINTRIGSLAPLKQRVMRKIFPRLQRFLASVFFSKTFAVPNPLFLVSSKTFTVPNPFFLFRALIKIVLHALFYFAARSPHRKFSYLFMNMVIKVIFEDGLHTNACGDFALLSATDWANLRGYPEWPMYSWHLDGILLFQAQNHGIREIFLNKPIYHMDHTSGYSPDEGMALFQRLDTRGIPYLNSADLHLVVARIKGAKEKVVFNDENWGLADQALSEIIL